MPNIKKIGPMKKRETGKKADPVKPQKVSARASVTLPKSSPLYTQVKESLIHRVLSGEWKPGELLPSEQALAVEYGLSQGTVRKAVSEMSSEGLVTRRAGRGTFVASHSGDYRPSSFHPIYQSSGKRVAEDECIYLSAQLMRPEKRVVAGLQIGRRDKVTEIIRLRRCEKRTAVVERTYLSEALCPNAHSLILKQQPHSMYVLLEKAYNLLIMRVEERVRARAAADWEAMHLGIAPGTPVLEIERTAFSLGNERVEWRLMVCETSDFFYLNQNNS